MRRVVTDGAIMPSPAATMRMPATRSAAGVRLSRKPLAPALKPSYTYSSRSKVVRMRTREVSSRPSATMARVASIPFITGICTSISTTSGSRRRVSSSASPPSPASPDDLDVGLGLEDETQARAHHLLVVGQHHGDAHVPSLGSGRRARTAKPPSARGPASSSPLNVATRSRMPTRPRPPPATPAATAAAVVDDLDGERVLLVAHGHRRARLAGVLERVGQRFLDDAIGGEIEAGRQAPAPRPPRAAATGSPASRTCAQSALQLAEARRRVEARAVVGRAQDAEHALDVAERLAAGRLDAAQGLAGQLRLGLDDRCAAPACSTTTLSACPTLSCSSRARRERSSATASRARASRSAAKSAARRSARSMLPRYTRMTTAMTQTTESEAQVLERLSATSDRGSSRSTTITPGVTRNPAATARRPRSKATVAKEATTTAHMAACVNS